MYKCHLGWADTPFILQCWTDMFLLFVESDKILNDSRVSNFFGFLQRAPNYQIIFVKWDNILILNFAKTLRRWKFKTRIRRPDKAFFRREKNRYTKRLDRNFFRLFFRSQFFTEEFFFPASHVSWKITHHSLPLFSLFLLCKFRKISDIYHKTNSIPFRVSMTRARNSPKLNFRLRDAHWGNS